MLSKIFGYSGVCVCVNSPEMRSGVDKGGEDGTGRKGGHEWTPTGEQVVFSLPGERERARVSGIRRLEGGPFWTGNPSGTPQLLCD